MDTYAIGEISERTGLPVDTLRYYERIGLLRPVRRDSGGRRCYQSADIERLGFIVRAKQMDFSLAEISTLLQLRDKPQNVRPQVRSLAKSKLDAIARRIEELKLLRDELTLLLNLCADADAGCPILDSLSNSAAEARFRAGRQVPGDER